jgi:hypothetical protein
MAIPQVDINSFTIATQVQTINEIATLEGDLTTLTTTPGSRDNLVEAINEIKSDLLKAKRILLTYSMAMS